jgi:cytochrome c553
VVASSDLVHELAVVGLGAKDSAARGAVYGRLVAACSACHEAMGRAPGARVDTAGE